MTSPEAAATGSDATVTVNAAKINNNLIKTHARFIVSSVLYFNYIAAAVFCQSRAICGIF